MFHDPICRKIAQLANFLISKNLTLGTAESCTGGGLSYALTSMEGSSKWFDRGLVTYSNEAKITLLNINKITLRQHGAVSSDIAKEMVQGLLQLYPLDLGVAITGIAGPDGGTPDKPVGTIWIAVKAKNTTTESIHYQFHGDRNHIRLQCIEAAIDQLNQLCGKIM